ncbi:hypothetical protein M3J09_010195 [Ascochyta lentis]
MNLSKFKALFLPESKLIAQKLALSQLTKLRLETILSLQHQLLINSFLL